MQPRISSTLSLLICLLLGLNSHGQSPIIQFSSGEPAVGGRTFVFMLQGEKAWITEDYVAEMDANSRLMVSLSDSGLSTPTSADAFLVTLIQSDGSSRVQSPNENGELIFEDVTEGWSALVVVAKNVALSSQTAMYAAIPILTRPAAAGQPKRSASIPVATVDKIRLVEDLRETSDADSSSDELLPADAFQIATASRYRVKRNIDGMVHGRVVVPQRGYEAIPGVTRLVFYRDGRYLSSVLSTPEGRFVVNDLPLGTNSLVATGPAGHTAFAFEVVSANQGDLIQPTASHVSVTSPRYVSLPIQAQAADELIVVLVPPALMPEVRRIVNDAYSSPLEGVPALADAGAPAPGMGGSSGFGGGGFGGGGSGGGAGGGFGAAAAFAGLAAIGIASSDNDDFNFSQPVASRIAP